MRFIDLGITKYADAEKIQLETFNSLIESIDNINKKENIVYIVEHYPVYTLGKNGKIENVSKLVFENANVDFHKINRGGDITFHGIGQLVSYPILNLKNFNIGLAEYIEKLEFIGIELCDYFGIKATTLKGANGVWIDADNSKARKIMAIGIKASRYITMHGIAFNVNTNLEYFDYIVPCGISDKSVTSLQKELDKEIDMNLFKSLYKDTFSKYFIELDI